MRTKPKRTPVGTNYRELWERKYKPLILSYYEVPIEVVAEVLGISVTKVQEQLRSGSYEYGIARPCKGGTYRYEFMPLRLISYIEMRNYSDSYDSNRSNRKNRYNEGVLCWHTI